MAIPSSFTPEGALLQVNEYLQGHHLSRYYHLRLDPTEGIHVSAHRQARHWETLIDGKLIVETTLQSTTADEVIRRYKDLQLIERAFRCLKSSLKLRPVHHWTEKRIRAHVFLCVLALQVERYMQTHLEDVLFSVQSALDKLKNIKAGQLSLNEVEDSHYHHGHRRAERNLQTAETFLPKYQQVTVVVVRKSIA